ncbi:dnaJ homolog subfamily C member [Nesidiocoris tenuis]|uniref:DnaJ homolog subfamily C member 2 n=1 Tax=Nesidiocoris tenuis TaxID=355587 RepID=A0ABN7ALT2_9HEMI|nr:dnaJ homolog subfamily C member [Nesidiocoris tenuis]
MNHSECENVSECIFAYKNVECVGPHFIRYLTSVNRGLNGSLDELSEDESEEESFVVDEDNEAYLKSLDPKEWKKQDHYAVLGLKGLRYAASTNMIKSAYRQQVLKHHPDKRKAKGEVVNRDDDYFSCITKAWETLGDQNKRRSFDSVDPYFDDSIPSASEVAKKDFFEVFSKFFELNARWSEKQPVPLLGGPDDSREEVNKFYSFWYDLNSWREYSYEDEEAKETGQDRDERRWIEKQNKVVRAKKKKEEMARIRSLVDLAYNADPRIIKFKQMDRDKKEAYKKAKADAAKQKAEEELRSQREVAEKEAKEKEEAKKVEEERQKAMKSERESAKRALKKSRKTLRDLCKDNNYFITDNDSNLVKHMEFVEKMCNSLGPKEMDELSTVLTESGADGFASKLKEEEARVQMEMLKISSKGGKQVNGGSSSKGTQWSENDIALLIKGVNLFPAGTAQRWEVVANFINQHSKSERNPMTAKDVLSKAKELQTNEEYNNILKRQANQRAFDNVIEKSNKSGSVEAEASHRFDTAQSPAAAKEAQNSSEAWTSDEQKLLEQALKTYPASTEERWDKIAAVVKTRTKKDCMKRYKELVEMVKAKKAVKKVS